MRKISLTRTDKIAMAVVTSLLAIAACAGTFEANGELVNQKFGVKITWGDNKVTAEDLPPGTRADVRFQDADGNDLPPGADGVGEGESVETPEGAVTATATGPSSSGSCTGCCENCGGGGGGGIWDPLSLAPCPVCQGGTIPPAVPQEKFLIICTLKPDLDGSTVLGNVAASFWLQSYSTSTPSGLLNMVRDILLNGPGTEVPSRVEVLNFVRLIPEVDGATLQVADKTQSLAVTSFVWNSGPPPSTFAYSSPANGWQLAEMAMPDASFNLSGNIFELAWITTEDTSPNMLNAGAMFW